MSQADDIGLIRVGEKWRYFPGIQAPQADWPSPGFADAAWPEDTAGFSTPGGYGDATILSGFNSAYQTVYFRKRFTVADPAAIKELILRLDYNDGFVLYLNGREAARRGLAGEPGTAVAFNAPATPHPRAMVEEIDLTASLGDLRAGENTLAVQVANSPGDFAFVFVPELLANFIRTPYVQDTTPTSTRIVWKTFSPADGLIEYGTNRSSAIRRPVSEAATNHVAALRELLPDTRYEYRIGSRSAAGEAWSDWSSFKTFKPDGSFSFAVIGDTGWASPQQYQVAGQMRKSEVDLIVHVGDLCYPAINQFNADQRVLSVYARQMRTTPMYWVPGNHDANVNIQVPLELFHQPTNSVTGTELYYSFDHGDAHFTMIWSDLTRTQYQPGSPQYQWIEQDLAGTGKPWKFLFLHHSWRTSAIHQIDDYDFNGVRDMVQLEAVAELAARHGVQAFFNGHDHCYERFTPNRGIVSFLSGGGGAGLYGLYGKHPDTVQFFANYEFLKVSVTRDEVTLRAIDERGGLLDTTHLTRAFPEKRVYEAAWHRPEIETAPADDFDGNILGQTFDFAGEGIPAKPGASSNAGRLYVNNDGEFLYLGLDNMMLHDGDEVLLFLESPGVTGTTDLAPFGWELAFTNFAPAAVAILGDELADRPAAGPGAAAQGAMWLRSPPAPIPGQRLQQFNRSPHVGPSLHERAANFAELSFPLAALKLAPGDSIRVAAAVSLNQPARPIDSGGIRTSGFEPVEVRLAAAPAGDRDQDGMTDAEEVAAGTNPADAASRLEVSVARTGRGSIELSWTATPGKWYTLQALHAPEQTFRDVLQPGFPRQASGTVERLTLPAAGPRQVYRIAVQRD